MRFVFVSVILASCVGYSVQVWQDKEFSVGNPVCTSFDGIRIQPGEEYTSYQSCSTCKCTGTPRNGLRMECCGFGINGGIYDHPPAGCKYIEDDQCEGLLVKENDESTVCD